MKKEHLRTIKVSNLFSTFKLRVSPKSDISQHHEYELEMADGIQPVHHLHSSK